MAIYEVFAITEGSIKRIIDGVGKEYTGSKIFKEDENRFKSCIVKIAFEPYMIDFEFPFETQNQEVNNFKMYSTFLNGDDVRINITRTKKQGTLCNNKPAKYKIKEASANEKYNTQIEFCFDNEDGKNFTDKSEYVFVILGYSFDNNNEIKHLDFMIPSSKMDNTIDKFNALNEYNKFKNGFEEDEYIEEKIVELIEEFDKTYKMNEL
ncbi:MAG: hypothetical protein LBR30_00115 [Clostridioides sp.]|jgi:hypothetical protein|nr:hypothetical protein [Clostridioides sp.]